jgi:hypothetical protein
MSPLRKSGHDEAWLNIDHGGRVHLKALIWFSDA